MFDQCDTKGRLVSTNRTHHLSFANKAFFHRELGKGTAGDALRKFLGGGPVSNQVKYEIAKQGLDQEGSENEGLTQKFRTSSFIRSIQSSLIFERVVV